MHFERAARHDYERYTAALEHLEHWLAGPITQLIVDDGGIDLMHGQIVQRGLVRWLVGLRLGTDLSKLEIIVDSDHRVVFYDEDALAQKVGVELG